MSTDSASALPQGETVLVGHHGYRNGCTSNGWSPSRSLRRRMERSRPVGCPLGRRLFGTAAEAFGRLRFAWAGIFANGHLEV